MQIEIERVNNKVHLEAKNEQGIVVQMDGSPDIGGEDLGARPMQLVLMALGGCTSMDMLSMLKKMREEVKSYKVTVNAERGIYKNPYSLCFRRKLKKRKCRKSN